MRIITLAINIIWVVHHVCDESMHIKRIKFNAEREQAEGMIKETLAKNLIKMMEPDDLGYLRGLYESGKGFRNETKIDVADLTTKQISTLPSNTNADVDEFKKGSLKSNEKLENNHDQLMNIMGNRQRELRDTLNHTKHSMQSRLKGPKNGIIKFVQAFYFRLTLYFMQNRIESNYISISCLELL